MVGLRQRSHIDAVEKSRIMGNIGRTITHGNMGPFVRDKIIRPYGPFVRKKIIRPSSHKLIAIKMMTLNLQEK